MKTITLDSNIAVSVKNLRKSFKLPHEQHSGIKQYLINTAKGKRNSGYEKQEVLKGLSFEIKEGEFFGIVGRNGSGKSTLLKTLAGIYTPEDGAVDIKGTLVPFIELGVGFNPELTGRENVFLNGALLGFSRREVEAMYDDIVEFAEIDKFMDQKLKNYSSGMQVRLAFSIAIRADADILLLDEVLAVGDQAFQQKCYSYFESLRDRGKTVVLVTHDMSAVERFCSRALLITNGKIDFIGNPHEVATLYAEENIKKTESMTQTGVGTSREYDIAAKITSQVKGSIKVNFSYTAKKIIDTYIGISVMRDGIAIADITTSLDKPLKGSGDIEYILDTSILNAGVYEINASLFRVKDRECLAISKKRNSFTIKGMDMTRGNALRLDDTWVY